MEPSLEPSASTGQAAGIGPKPWGVPAVLVALALPGFLWATSLLAPLFVETPDELTQGQIVASLLFSILIGFVFIGLATGLSLWRYHLSPRALGLGEIDLKRWWLPIVAAAGAHVAIIAYGAALIALGADAAVPEQEELEELFQSRTVLPLTGVATVLVAPVAEEIFFRGFIFAGLVRPFGLTGAMVASGLLFGAFHVTGLETIGLVLPFAAIGVLFAWVYARTGSLWPSVATHLLFNLVSFVALALFVEGGSG